MLYLDNNSREEKIEKKVFDVFISSLGYEKRCVYIPKKFAYNFKDKVCLKFEDQQELAYSDNEKTYADLGFKVQAWNEEIEKEVIIFNVLKVAKLNIERGPLYIGIDISSMNRKMVAELINILATIQNAINETLEISLLYAPATFTEPPQEVSAMKIVGPVIPEYAGWFDSPNDPLYAIIGLGYENGKAIGALEYLDAAAAWLFKPIGEDSAFEEKVDHENYDLISMLGSSRTINYELLDPYDTFVKLRSLVEGLMQNGRIVLVPFGPKLFNAICLVLAEIYQFKIAVWRVSAGDEETPVNHHASGKIVSFTYQIRN